MMEPFILLKGILPWVVFGLVHSALAMETVKSRFPLQGTSYRIFYNVIAVMTFFAVYLVTPKVEVGLDFLEEGLSFRLIMASVVGLAGIIFGVLGLHAWDIPGFMGLRDEKGHLVTDGIYAISRHPVYTSVLLLLVSMNILFPSFGTLTMLVGAGGYLVIGSYAEEIKLARVFPEYSEYRKNVGRFFPWRSRHFSALFC